MRSSPALPVVAALLAVRVGVGVRVRACMLAAAACALAGCASAPKPVAIVATVAPVAPMAPKDDGKPAEGGQGGTPHAAALEQLKAAPLDARLDRQHSMSVLLPDANHWTRVKFWGVPSLVGYRYGKDHHAIVAAFVTETENSTMPGVCSKSFEAWANPWVESFDVDIKRDAPQALVWNRQVADIDSFFARTATLAAREGYAAAYAAFPAWKNACLIVGVAVPARDDEARAKAVRDRFVREVLPRVQVVSAEEPKERY